MRVAFVLFDDLTALDFVGVYDPVTRLHSMGFDRTLTWELCALHATEVHDDRGLRLGATQGAGALTGFDLVIVPGGRGTQRLVTDAAFLAWLRATDPHTVMASVCTGSLLLGAAGLLQGLRATTHGTSLDALKAYGATPVAERVVDEGGVITAAGVTAALDLGLHIVQRYAGAETRARIAMQMQYPPPAAV